jgi:arylsulfatase A-like enzyme
MTGLDRRSFLKCSAAGALGYLAGAWARSAMAKEEEAPPKKPNFVFFLVDDLGWRDVGCYGTKFYETPNIDRLAREGMRFTDAYAACPVCSPTRASILTGKYPARLSLTDWIPGQREKNPKLLVPKFNQELPLEEVTIAEALKATGYACASIGKWHLGGEPYYPDKQGFDLNVGGTAKGSPPSYFSPYGIPTLADGPKGEYLTDRLADEAEKFIEQNRYRPFFLYLPHFAVHTPIQGKEEIAAKYARKPPDGGQKNATYAAMIESVDQSVGRVMKKLDALGLADRTVVFFMSDNGGLAGITSNAPLRAGKGTLYEGGIREPMIVKWPGVVRSGTTASTPVTSTDFYPTILEMAGLPPKPEQHVDGLSIMPLLKESGPLRRDTLYWHYPHYHRTTPAGALRHGDWKLIEYFEDGRLELYNLRDDLGEANDLATAMPEKARELQKMLAEWRRSVGAQMPTPNPDYKEGPEAGGRPGKSRKTGGARS